MREAIRVEGLGKRYTRFHPDRPTTLQEAFARGLRGMRPAERFWALRGLDFTLAPGRMLGVIGTNGAGKSTLLRLLGGVGRPDEGRVATQGRIGALLDLGAGFHPDLTGRENVFVNGVIAGLTRSEVAARFDDIVAFAELEAFIDAPVRTYSTGMGMRLAFAIAVHTDPEILLIDEVLAVGDITFQRKCLRRIGEFKERGCAIVLVSHDPSQVREMCDEALWLKRGSVVAHGDSEVVVGQYVSEMMAETRRRTPVVTPSMRTEGGTELRINDNRFGSLELEISAVRLIDGLGRPAAEIASGDRLRVEMDYRASLPVEAPIFGVTLSREDGLTCCDLHSVGSGIARSGAQQSGSVALDLERLDLAGGQYFVNVGAYAADWAYAYDYHWHVYPLLVRSAEGNEKGVLYPPHRWDAPALWSPAMHTAALSE